MSLIWLTLLNSWLKILVMRYLKKFIESDLNNKMVFIGGPRQVGKTTLGLSFLPSMNKTDSAYLNWDVSHSRKKIISNLYPADFKILLFDEIHKYSKWKNYLKGFYDEFCPEQTCLVTGSAMMNVYKRGGDSLLGRYHHYRLHPFTLQELNLSNSSKDIDQLLKFGGFPEPFLKAEERFHRRWQNERQERVIHEDLRDIQKVLEISNLDILADALPSKVGSPLSVKSLREDIGVSHDAVKKWLETFEKLYFIFRISPFGSPKIRAVKKEQKMYFWDWSQTEETNHGARFENFVASHLLQYCHFIEDTEGHKMELRFIRDTDLREIDFVVIKNKKPIFAVECKSGEKSISKSIEYFKQRTQIPLFFQVHMGKSDYLRDQVRVIPFWRFAKEYLNLEK
jgi:predicted AAA+ superfamily ATPase